LYLEIAFTVAEARYWLVEQPSKTIFSSIAIVTDTAEKKTHRHNMPKLPSEMKTAGHYREII
jgi:hypothetical protein